MSMLAERKRKQKWSLNPRGKDWAQDANKFGQKMLEKMGWQLGKGLGANEDGITEHVKVSYKNDSKGMGYKESDDQWTEHETNFTALLESLSGKSEKLDEIKLQSLEKKSETSRARVHYHKFTRGKDLSRYSEKDLANIFGKKSLKESKKNVNVSPISTSEVEKVEKESKFIVNAGSMKDYFKKKLPNFGKGQGYVVGSNGVLTKTDSDYESDTRASFSFNGAHNSDAEESTRYVGFGFKSEVKVESDKKKKNKRKVGEMEEWTPKKKWKKDVGDKLDNDALGVSNPAYNPSCTPVKVDRHVLTTIEETFSEDVEVEENCGGEIETEPGFDVSKKKKKKKNVLAEENLNFEESTKDNSQFDSSFDESHKKKKKEELCIENPCFNGSYEDSMMEIEENPYEVRVSGKKKKKKAELALENPGFDESGDISIRENNVYELKTKKKKNSEDSQVEETPKKTKKKKKTMKAVENPCFNASLEESTNITRSEENPYEVKKRKKKRKALPLENPTLADMELEENSYEVKRKKRKEMAIENPCFDDTINDSIAFSPVETERATTKNLHEVERKKKKSKKKCREGGVANPGLDVQAETPNLDIVESDLVLNIVTTPILAKPTTANVDDTFSINKATGIKRRKSVRFSDVTQERIIPNNDELKSLNDIADRNELFDINAQVLNRSLDEENRIEENLASISKTLDRYQAEIENDMNEKKLETFTMDDVMVGEVGNPDGENESLAEGTKLKFKYAHFQSSKTPFYQLDKVGPRKGYRHLIKGDIVVKFNSTNLHQIEGYGVKSKGVVK